MSKIVPLKNSFQANLNVAIHIKSPSELLQKCNLTKLCNNPGEFRDNLLESLGSLSQTSNDVLISDDPLSKLD